MLSRALRQWSAWIRDRGPRAKKESAFPRRTWQRPLFLESLEGRQLLATLVGIDFDISAAEGGPPGWAQLLPANARTGVTDSASGIGVVFYGSGFIGQSASMNFTSTTVPTDLGPPNAIRNGFAINSPAIGLVVLGLSEAKSYEVWVLGGSNHSGAIIQDVQVVDGSVNTTFRQEILASNLWVNGVRGSNSQSLEGFRPILMPNPVLVDPNGDEIADGFGITVAVTRVSGSTINLAGVAIREYTPSPTYALPAGGGAFTLRGENGKRVLKNDANNAVLAIFPATGAITIEGTDGADETLSVSLTGDSNPLVDGVTFQGGANGNDSLKIVGGNQGAVAFEYANGNDGSVVLTNYGTLSYSGLEALSNTGSASDVAFQLPVSGATAASLGDDGTAGNSRSRLSGNTFPPTDFTNPSGTVAIQRGSAADSVQIDTMPDFSAGLTIGSVASPFMTVDLEGGLTLAGGKSLNAVATTFTATAAGVVAVSGGGAINLAADAVHLNPAASLSAGSGVVAIAPITSDRAISLGGGDNGQLGLTNAELERITAGTLKIGDANSGTIAVDAAITSNTNLALTGSDFTSGGGSLGTSGESITLVTTGAIGTSAERVRFADNPNAAQQVIHIGQGATQPSSVYLHGLGNFTLGSISGGISNAVIDVTASANLRVLDGSTIDSGAGSLSLAADVTAAAAGDDGVGTLIIGDAVVTSANVDESGIALRGADIELTSNSAAVAATGALGRITIRSSLPSRPISIGGLNSAVSGINLTDAELARFVTASTGFIGMGDESQEGDITFTTATVTTTTAAGLIARQSSSGLGRIILDNESGAAAALNESGNITLIAGQGGIVEAANNTANAPSISGAATTDLRARGPIGAASRPLRLHNTSVQTSTSASSSNQFLSSAGSVGFAPGGLDAGTGTVELSGGLFTQTSSNQIQDATRLNINGATLAIGASEETVHTLTLVSGVITGSTGVLTSINTVQTNSGTISAILAGENGLTQSTGGVTTLTRVNAFTGPTSINEGTLIINGSIASDVTISGSGQLAGSGTVYGSLASSGVVFPGSSVGTLNVGEATFHGGSVLELDIDETPPGLAHDQLAISGNANLAGAIAVSGSYTPIPGQTSFAVLTYTGARSGNFDTTSVVLNGQTLNVVYDDTNQQVLLQAPAGLTAAFTATPSPAAPGQSIAFDASSSSAASGHSITSYAWDFGDGSTAFGANVTHSFSQFGIFTVRLTVVDDLGNTHSTTHTSVIDQGNRAPIARAGGPYVAPFGEAVPLNGSTSSDPDAAYGDYLATYAWDINNDGIFGDVTGATPTVPASALSGFTLGVAATIRLRVTDSFGAANVQDSTLTLYGQDFGDAPTAAQTGFLANYPTLLVDNGARHLALGATLGTSRDHELDGQPHVSATGDDASGIDDESLFASPITLVAGRPVDLPPLAIEVPSGFTARVFVWVDFNRDGDFADTNENIDTSGATVFHHTGASQTYVVPTFSVPLDASVGTTYMRVRLSSQAGLGASGNAPDGEVEDYLVTIAPANQSPTAIALSNASIRENAPPTTSIGTFSTADPDAGDTFTYALVPGEGSSGNGSFTIENDGVLRANVGFDYEAQNLYSIRVRSTDQGGLDIEETFLISILDADEIAPTVTINQSAGQADPTGVAPLSFTVTFSEPVSGFGSADIDFSGSTTPGSLAAIVQGSGPTYTVLVSGMTGGGVVRVSVGGGAAQDAAGNSSLPSTSSDNLITYQAPNAFHIPGGFNQLVVMLDPSATKLQIRHGSTSGQVLYEAPLASLTALHLVGSGGSETITIDDIHGLPSFLGSVPASSGVGNHPAAGDNDASPEPELYLSGGGGTDVLRFHLNRLGSAQTYAPGTGAGPGAQEGEVQTTFGAVGLNIYFQGVAEVQNVGRAGGELTVVGDSLDNAFTISAASANTVVVAQGYVPFTFSGNNYSRLTVQGQAGNDSLDLLGLGTGQRSSLPVTLMGGNDDDLLKVRGTSGNTGALTLLGQAGDDLIVLSSSAAGISTWPATPAGNVDGINARIAVDGGPAIDTDTLVVDDSSSLLGGVATITKTSIDGLTQAAGIDITHLNIDILDVSASGGMNTLYYDFLNGSNADLDTVRLRGSGGDDIFLPAAVSISTATTPLSQLSLLELIGGAGNDTFGSHAADRRIRPDLGAMSGTHVRIFGEEAATSPSPLSGNAASGDKLYLDVSQAAATVFVDTVLGRVSSSSHRELSIQGLEVLTMWDGPHYLSTVPVSTQMGDLYVRLSDAAETAQLTSWNEVPGADALKLTVQDVPYGPLAANRGVQLFARGGDDNVSVHASAPEGLIYELRGEAGNDTLIGAAGNDLLVGGPGNDMLIGGEGNNLLWGDNELVHAATGVLLQGSVLPSSTFTPPPAASRDLGTPTDGHDILTAGEGDDTHFGGGGNDTITDTGGSNYLNGGAGDDALTGGRHSDVLRGGPGNDRIAGGSDHDVLIGGDGVDHLDGGVGLDLVLGGKHGDTLIDSDDEPDMLVSDLSPYDVDSGAYSDGAGGNNRFGSLVELRSANDLALIAILQQWIHDAPAISRSAIRAGVLLEAATPIGTPALHPTVPLGAVSLSARLLPGTTGNARADGFRDQLSGNSSAIDWVIAQLSGPTRPVPGGSSQKDQLANLSAATGDILDSTV